MARDIEEFLKMAAARRQKQKQGGTEPPQQSRPPLTASGAYAPPASDEEVQIIEATPARDMRAKTVGRRVETHIDTSDIEEQASHLGEEVGLADEKIESRLQKKFDHDVGHLEIDRRKSAQSETTSVTAAEISPIAADLIKLLSSPQNVTQAILLHEILKRPDI